MTLLLLKLLHKKSLHSLLGMERLLNTRLNTRHQQVGFNTTCAMAAPLIESTALMAAEECVKVYWSSGPQPRRESLYPYLWLRDSCQCHGCFNASTKSRLFLMRDLDLNLSPKNVKLHPDKTSLEITWEPEGHVSCYDNQWLWDRHLTPPEERDTFYERQINLWGSELQDKVPSIAYEQFLTDDTALYRWLVALEETGLVLISGAPKNPTALTEITKRIAYPRTTNYGKYFTVKHKPNPSNAAYTRGSLGLHTDLPYYDFTPGVQMLHCIQQTDLEGGANEFADGIHVARQLQKTDPDTFTTLITTPVNFVDIGEDFIPYYLMQTKHTIELDKKGDIVRINYNNPVRNSVQSLSPDTTRSLMRALRQYNQALYNEKNIIRVKLTEGDIISFNNTRVLHGRTGYTASGTSERHLEGCFLDWDELRSLRRVLDMKGTL